MANSPARVAVDVGSVIADTYTIEALLGRGGMGAVFLASHKRLAGKRVAIKIIHTEIEDAEVLARFRREAEIAAKLNHPNIVGVIDYNVSPDGMPYLVLDYLEGETLAQRIERGPMPVDQVLSIVRQVGSALAAAHRAGIVHRDLKPQNIFLVATEVDGRPIEIAKVLDFGISKIRDSNTVKTQDSVLLGTPQYMAPEQAIGQQAKIDERTDVFAFGAIVYEMLSGQAAFAGESLPVVVFKVVYEQPPPLASAAPSVSPAIAAAVTRAMAKPSEDRFATVSGFVEAITGYPLAPTREPGAQGRSADGSPSGSRRASVSEAFDKTMGSGQAPREPAIDPMLATAAPGTGNRPSPTGAGAIGAASTMAVSSQSSPATARGVVGAAIPISSPGIASDPDAIATMDLHQHRGSEPQKRARRSVGLIAAIAIAGAAIAAGVVFAVTRPDHSGGAGGSARVAGVAAGTGKPIDTKGTDVRPPDTKPAETKPTKLVETKPAEPVDPRPAKPVDPKPAEPVDPRPAGGKPPRPTGPRPTRPTPTSGHSPAQPAEPADEPEGDSDVRDKIQQANAALLRRDFDLAERLANGVISSPGTPRQRAAGRLIHGTVQCLARNDQEAVQIDLRALESFRTLRAKLLSVCRNRGLGQ